MWRSSLARRPPDAIPGQTVARSGYRDVPPDVTTGGLVVVVGGLVVVVGGLVVVVGGLVVVVLAGAALAVGVVAGEEPPAEFDPAAVVVVVVVLVDVVVGEVVPDVDGCAVGGTEEGVGALAVDEDPGCSLATVTQMKAVAPPATRTAVLVMRLMRACARARAAGEYGRGRRLTPVQGRAGQV